MSRYDFAIIGGGIIGLATGMTLAMRDPRARIVVLEKESELAQHQTGRNSGVIHSGIYYRPGSLKANFARAGSDSMVAFCRKYGIPVEVCGKVIVATRQSELSRLDALYRRGRENGLSVRKLNPEQVQELEPHVRCLAGLHVPSTGIADYTQVCAKYAELMVAHGGEIRTATTVERITETPGGYTLETSRGRVETAFLINCAGLHSDRVAKLGGARSPARIIPFRGEYYQLRPEKRHLVKNLIYPVPDPSFPFLGVHFTRMIDGGVHAGPNAVLALAREGYRKTDVDLRDIAEVLGYAGFWRLARKHPRDGLDEMIRSWSKAAFLRSLRRMIPELNSGDLETAPSGVRAQSLLPNGQLVDDFQLATLKCALHVYNAPSPAATASLEIARAITQNLPARRSVAFSA